MVCDSMCHITNVEAKWPGSVHDSRIFRVTFMHIYTLIVGLTELHFTIVQVITMGSWLETGAMPVGSIL